MFSFLEENFNTEDGTYIGYSLISPAGKCICKDVTCDINLISDIVSKANRFHLSDEQAFYICEDAIL